MTPFIPDNGSHSHSPIPTGICEKYNLYYTVFPLNCQGLVWAFEKASAFVLGKTVCI
jgi:hypothetical protein